MIKHGELFHEQILFMILVTSKSGYSDPGSTSAVQQIQIGRYAIRRALIEFGKQVYRAVHASFII